MIHDILTRDPKPLREVIAGVSRDLDTIVMKCLDKTPARRYASARELADDLRAYVEGRGIRARRPTLAEQAARWFKQQRRGALLTAGSVVATLVVLAIGLLACGATQNVLPGLWSVPTPPCVSSLASMGRRERVNGSAACHGPRVLMGGWAPPRFRCSILRRAIGRPPFLVGARGASRRD